MRGIVFAPNAADVALVERTERSLARAGVAELRWVFGEAALARVLLETREPILVIRAGAWLLSEGPLAVRPSATGLPLAAFEKNDNCVYLEKEPAHEMAGLIATWPWVEVLGDLRNNWRFRRVELPELRTAFDGALRILQVVTTIQVGGAERVTLDLAEELNRQGQRAWVAALGRAPRAGFSTPRGFYDLAPVGRSIAARTEVFEKIARQQHLDVLHAHLLSAEEMEPLLATGLPLATTIHNLPQSWPRGFAEIAHRADLLIACCRAVESATTASELGAPCRTAWNGIATGRFAITAELRAEARAWRAEQGWSEDDLVLIAVANPRRQKRLERMPEIVAAVQLRMQGRRVRAIIAGEAASSSADGAAAQAALDSAIAAHGMQESFRQIGGAEKVRLLLAASDVFVSTSAFEGLSLAQLEALAAGLPVVATDVGGAAEIARELHDGNWYRRVAVEASADEFAEAILVHAAPDRHAAPGRASRLPAAFERSRMVWRCDTLYRSMISRRLRARKPAGGLWLITNNFSMGGAQTSARRLLVKLHERGVRVRAFTVQEEAPTRGAQGLTARGISVTAISPAHLRAPAALLSEMLAYAAADPPEAILFWNLITSCKVLLADALDGLRIFDVSPGEMCFQSLAQYFAKPIDALPYRTPREYGARLAGAVVKFERELATAREILGCPARVIRNGIEVPLEKPKVAGAKVIFGTAARISPDKRLEDLLAAFRLADALLPEYELHIAGRVENGADVYARGLREQARGLPVIWRGELGGTGAFLQELDIFVMISEPAGCPNASLEALAAGMPVIATDVGGAHEQIIDGVTGLLTPRRDAAALAHALVRLAGDAAARERFGRAGREHVRAAFSLEQMADAYTALCFPEAALVRSVVAQPVAG